MYGERRRHKLLVGAHASTEKCFRFYPLKRYVQHFRHIYEKRLWRHDMISLYVTSLLDPENRKKKTAQSRNVQYIYLKWLWLQALQPHPYVRL